MCVEKQFAFKLYLIVIFTLLTQDISYMLKEFEKEAKGFHGELAKTTSRHDQQLRHIRGTVKVTTRGNKTVSQTWRCLLLY